MPRGATLCALGAWAACAAAAGEPDYASWFLSADELLATRGGVDRGMAAWTTGNRVTANIGAELTAAVYDEVVNMTAGDVVRTTNWLTGPDWLLRPELSTESRIGPMFKRAAVAGAEVSSIVWMGTRPLQDDFDIINNSNAFVGMINSAGATGQAFTDGRIFRGLQGSHHQKTYITRRAGVVKACLGGIDISKDRWDVRGQNTSYPRVANVSSPRGMAQEASRLMRLTSQGGYDGYPSEPGWRDMSVCIDGPGALDVDTSFLGRWNEMRTRAGIFKSCPMEPSTRTPVAPLRGDNATHIRTPGTVATQVLETYGCGNKCFGFAPKGDQAAMYALVKAINQAERFVYIEDQYGFLVEEVQEAIQRFMRRAPEGRVVFIIQYPVAAELMTTLFYFMWEPLRREFGGERVKAYYRAGGVYLHTKMRIIDDTWAFVGSQNFNRRSFGYDSEIGVAMMDAATRATPDGYAAAAFMHELRMNSLEDNTGVPASVWAGLNISAMGDLLDEVGGQPLEAQPHLLDYAKVKFNATYAPQWYMKGPIGRVLRDLVDPTKCHRHASPLLASAAVPQAELQRAHDEIAEELAKAPAAASPAHALLVSLKRVLGGEEVHDADDE